MSLKALVLDGALTGKASFAGKSIEPNTENIKKNGNNSNTTRAARVPPAFVEPHAESGSLAALRRQAETCERCDLYKNATQTVFGEGPTKAKVVLVGEQPGDREDIAGKPFVGSAGRLLDECLHEASIDRSLCYVTNAVKHFKFEQRGKRRLHSKPNAGEIQRCAWWLGGEIDVLRPDLIVALGATALYALMGRSVGLTKERGHVLQATNDVPVLVTIHPSYLLRIRDHDDRAHERRLFVDDLRIIRHYLDHEVIPAERKA
jgi:uracil-DNA glycosylase family protein